VRAVVDTNVLISGLLWDGAPHALLTHVRDGTLGLISSTYLLSELSRTIGRAKFSGILMRSNISQERVLTEVRQLAEMIEPPPLPQPVCRDPDDDEVLALAVAAKADWIVSGDNDLLSLGSYAGIAIIPVTEAVKRIIPE
jgi:putative PIN family toxin of toxin-antitoxin system